MDKFTYDITEVCKMLGTTSRTLRFYEQKGLIESEKGYALRRNYTESQVARIRNVLVLRTLGLSLKSISEIQNEEIDLKNAVISRRAEIIAVMQSKIKEISLLNDAIAAIEQGKDIFEEDVLTDENIENSRRAYIVRECSEAFVHGEYSVFYNYFSDRMKEYLPPALFEKITADTVSPLGDFVTFGALVSDNNSPNVLYQYLEYEKLGMRLKFVFHGDVVHGFWQTYYDNNKSIQQERM